jgi:hypothetical protein
MRGRVWTISISAAVLAGGVLSTTPALAAPPVVKTEPATSVRRATAVFNGAINPEGSPTVYYFEYGPAPCDLSAGTCRVKTETRGPTTAPSPGEPALPTEPLKVQRLKPGTTYHLWLVASNTEGSFHGEEQTFTTTVAEPTEYKFEKDLSGYEFVGVRGVDINQATQDVYAFDSSSSPTQIEQFNAAGKQISSIPVATGGFMQLAVDNACYYQKLSEPGCKTKDPSNGDVYISNEGASAIYRLEPNANGELKAAGEITGAGINGPVGVAVDAAGNVYVANYGSSAVSEFSPTGTLLNTELISVSDPENLAVDPAGNVYVGTGSYGTTEYIMSKYTIAGKCANAGECEQVSPGDNTGIALDPAGDVFVSNGTVVHEYGPAPGHIPIENPHLEGLLGPSSLAVNDTTDNLYIADGTKVEVFQSFAFTPVIVKTEEPTPISGTAESLNGKVNPNGKEPAEYYFEYGTAPCNTAAGTCGTVASEQSEVPLNGDEAIAVSAHVEGLAPNTTYHEWVIGVNEESGIEHGEEQTFTTGEPTPPPPPPPSEGSAPVSSPPASSPVYPLLTSIVPVPGPKEVVKKTLTRAQRLAKALSACNHKGKKQRAACKRQARKKYGPVTKSVAKKRRK